MVHDQICRHTYGRDAIKSHIKVSKKHPASCPVAGCLQKVTKADLEPDKDMERRVSKHIINCRHQLSRYVTPLLPIHRSYSSL